MHANRLIDTTYIGKWVRFELRVDDISEHDPHLIVSQDDFALNPNMLVSAHFPRSEEPRLAHLQHGDTVRGIGRIDGLADGCRAFLVDCELDAPQD